MGQVERMNRTLKEATVKTYPPIFQRGQSFEALQKHLDAFMAALYGAKHLKVLKLTPPLKFLMEKFLNRFLNATHTSTARDLTGKHRLLLTPGS